MRFFRRNHTVCCPHTLRFRLVVFFFVNLCRQSRHISELISHSYIVQFHLHTMIHHFHIAAHSNAFFNMFLSPVLLSFYVQHTYIFSVLYSVNLILVSAWRESEKDQRLATSKNWKINEQWTDGYVRMNVHIYEKKINIIFHL